MHTKSKNLQNRVVGSLSGPQAGFVCHERNDSVVAIQLTKFLPEFRAQFVPEMLF